MKPIILKTGLSSAIPADLAYVLSFYYFSDFS